MAVKQVIEIDVTWDTYSTQLSLNALIAWLANNDKLPIKRISVREVKKR